MIASYVKQLKGRLELHCLPGYTPALNPDEFVWNYVKREGVSSGRGSKAISPISSVDPRWCARFLERQVYSMLRTD